MKLLFSTLVLVMAACGGGSSKPSADAAPACTGQVYDSCNPNANNCTNGMECHNFSGAGFSVCTPTCSAGSPCPNQGTTSISCNNMGLCKPAAPNAGCSAP